MQENNTTSVRVQEMQPLVLAMIGDSVQTLFVRKHVAMVYGVKVNKMNKYVSSVVSAGSQFKTFKKIEETLSQEEQDIARRARNTHIHSKSKNFSITEYIYATALEAVIGYLHLTGQEERLNQILTLSLEEMKVE
jgi:ribonuclease-3 family protein